MIRRWNISPDERRMKSAAEFIHAGTPAREWNRERRDVRKHDTFSFSTFFSPKLHRLVTAWSDLLCNARLCEKKTRFACLKCLWNARSVGDAKWYLHNDTARNVTLKWQSLEAQIINKRYELQPQVFKRISFISSIRSRFIFSMRTTIRASNATKSLSREEICRQLLM